MAIFLRGNIWWLEYRTRRERIVKSTGFPREKKKEAQAVLDAIRLARTSRPPRAAMTKIIDAIYAKGPKSTDGVRLEVVWPAYQDWLGGKGRVLSAKSMSDQHSAWERFRAWAEEQGYQIMEDVDVALARRYIRHLREMGRANKTLRNIADTLSHLWSAVGQLRDGLHNPWQAARPDNDGSSIRLEAFTADEEIRLFEAARKIGSDWYLASLIARWTGLRYGDVATLEWSDINWEKSVIDTIPNKTRKHKVRVIIPLAQPLKTELEALRSQSDVDLDGFILPRHGAAYPTQIDPSYKAVLQLAGIDTTRHTFHSWRHTFRTRLADAGVSDDIARRLGGWTNLRMAAHYDHAERLAELRDAIGRMDVQ